MRTLAQVFVGTKWRCSQVEGGRGVGVRRFIVTVRVRVGDRGGVGCQGMRGRKVALEDWQKGRIWQEDLEKKESVVVSGKTWGKSKVCNISSLRRM